jgi:glycerophosphoryl diester phosphodiesterase
VRLGRPLVIAHRGASKARLENTIAAFRAAEEQGADGVELDVMRCRSGEVVVFHDDDLRRLAARTEVVTETPWSILHRVELMGGERIPTLGDVFAALGPDTLVNVELKSRERQGLRRVGMLLDDGLPAAVAQLVARYGMSARVLVSSFDPFLLHRFQRLAPTIPTALLFHGELSRPLREAWAAHFIEPAALHPEARMITAQQVARWHARQVLVNVWTVDAPQEIAFLGAVGVDGIITNEPGVARGVLDGKRAAGSGI